MPNHERIGAQRSRCCTALSSGFAPRDICRLLPKGEVVDCPGRAESNRVRSRLEIREIPASPLASTDFSDQIAATNAEHFDLLAVADLLADRGAGKICLAMHHAHCRIAELLRDLQHLNGIVAIAVAQLRRDRQRADEDQSGEHFFTSLVTLTPVQIRCHDNRAGDAANHVECALIRASRQIPPCCCRLLAADSPGLRQIRNRKALRTDCAA